MKITTLVIPLFIFEIVDGIGRRKRFVDTNCYDTPPAVANGDRTWTYQIASYVCNEGYYGSGNSRLECTEVGIGYYWETLSFTCNVVDCGDPPAISNGIRTFSGTSYQSVATYSCNTGYTGFGSNTITCEGSNAWGSLSFSCDLTTSTASTTTTTTTTPSTTTTTTTTPSTTTTTQSTTTTPTTTTQSTTTTPTTTTTTTTPITTTTTSTTTPVTTFISSTTGTVDGSYVSKDQGLSTATYCLIFLLVLIVAKFVVPYI